MAARGEGMAQMIERGPLAPSPMDGGMDRGPIRAYLDELRALLTVVDDASVRRVIDVLLTAYTASANVFIFGNGGSAATASHFACDLGKGVPGVNGKRFKVVSLTDNVPMLTAWANDTRFDRVFAEQLENLVRPRDVVVGISSSGNSPNVLRAMELARERGATTVGLTGFRGGQLKALCDVCVIVPSDQIDQVEDAHLALQHLVCRVLREILATQPSANGACSPARRDVLNGVYP
jgi:D-sedoheptulose 7-phosphate isomerase